MHKAHNIEQPLQLVCPLEIGVAETIVQPHERRREINLRSQRPTPNVAQRAAQRIANNCKQNTCEQNQTNRHDKNGQFPVRVV